MDGLLKVLDIAIGAMNVATRANELISKARAEDRDVTQAELDDLVAESDRRRDEWDNAGG